MVTCTLALLLVGGGCGQLISGCGHLICVHTGLASLSLGECGECEAVPSWFQEPAAREPSRSDSSKSACVHVDACVMCDCVSCERWRVMCEGVREKAAQLSVSPC